MNRDNASEINADEIEWDEAVIGEGRQPGSVVSVRLDPEETARLRQLANALGVTVSQVLRRALAAYDPAGDATTSREILSRVFTYGGSVPLSYETAFTVGGLWQLGVTESGGGVPTATEPTRIVERVTTRVLPKR
jgi:hypothetical protein